MDYYQALGQNLVPARNFWDEERVRQNDALTLQSNQLALAEQKRKLQQEADFRNALLRHVPAQTMTREVKTQYPGVPADTTDFVRNQVNQEYAPEIQGARDQYQVPNNALLKDDFNRIQSSMDNRQRALMTANMPPQPTTVTTQEQYVQPAQYAMQNTVGGRLFKEQELAHQQAEYERLEAIKMKKTAAIDDEVTKFTTQLKNIEASPKQFADVYRAYAKRAEAIGLPEVAQNYRDMADAGLTGKSSTRINPQMVKAFPVGINGVEMRALKIGGDASKPEDWVALSKGLKTSTASGVGGVSAADIEMNARAVLEKRLSIDKVQGTRGVRQAVVNRVEEMVKELNLDPINYMADISDFAAGKSSQTLVTKQLDMSQSFIDTIDKNIAQLKTHVADAATRHSMPTNKIMNMGVRTYNNLVGDSDFNIYDMLVNAISTENAKLVSGGAGSVAQVAEGARTEMEKIHSKNLPISEMFKLLEATRREGQNRIEALQSQRSRSAGRSKEIRNVPKSVSDKNAFMKKAVDAGYTPAEADAYWRKKHGGK
jgi:hypothetical protein